MTEHNIQIDLTHSVTVKLKNVITSRNELRAKNGTLHMHHGNLYYIKMVDAIDFDKFHAIKQFSTNGDLYRILTIKDSQTVVLEPIFNNCKVRDKEIIGKVI